MATRGFLIRFIDIGLIVLFGFLMISDIDVSSRVDLASPLDAEEEPDTSEVEERAFILVEIGADGAYRVSDPREGGEFTRAETPEALSVELERRSREHRARGTETVVLLQPHPASLVQETVDAMDVCDRLSLPKSLRMDIEIAPPPVGGGNEDDEGEGEGEGGGR
jgi:biopolymer transport protein ExbD